MAFHLPGVSSVMKKFNMKNILFFSIFAICPAKAFVALDVESPYQSQSTISLFSTHADSGYEDFPEVQDPIDNLIAKMKANHSEVFYIGKNSLMCSLVEQQVRTSPLKFPTLARTKGDLSRFTCYKFEPTKPKIYPTDLNPTAIVYESIGGEHSVSSAATAIISGGNFGGCAGTTAARVLALWVLNKKYDGHIWFVPGALYNSGCFDYSDTSATSENHEKNRLGGKESSLLSCLADLKINTDVKVANYLRGYFRLWLLPLMLDKYESRRLDKFSLTEFSIVLYSKKRPVDVIGTGKKKFHLHLGSPL